MDAAELRALGRRHAPADVAETVRAARDAGIDSVSLDLLYDVPGQTLDDWSRTLDAALALEPDHLSLYALTLDDPDAEGITGPAGDHLPLRPGARRWRDRARAGQDEDRAAAMYELADERLARAGFAWYEISNWARPGHRSRHNLAYWRGATWEAVGPGAHAFDGGPAAGMPRASTATSPRSSRRTARRRACRRAAQRPTRRRAARRSAERGRDRSRLRTRAACPPRTPLERPALAGPLSLGALEASLPARAHAPQRPPRPDPPRPPACRTSCSSGSI